MVMRSMNMCKYTRLHTYYRYYAFSSHVYGLEIVWVPGVGPGDPPSKHNYFNVLPCNCILMRQVIKMEL